VKNFWTMMESVTSMMLQGEPAEAGEVPTGALDEAGRQMTFWEQWRTDESGVLYHLEAFRGEHPAISATLILMLSFVLARIVNGFISGTIRTLVKRTETIIDDSLIAALHKPVMKTVVLFGAMFAAKELATVATPLIWVRHLVVTLMILVWAGAGLRIVGLLLRAMSKTDKKFLAVEARTLPLFDNLAKVLLIGLTGYLVMEVWNVDPGAWLASAGVAGIALGFAAKDTLANLFAGVFIIGDAPYQIGDYIVLDTGHRGRVLYIGLRSTKILTRDDVQITVPNSLIGNGAIINETSGTPQYRLKALVGVAYGSDIDRVKELLQEVAIETGVLMEDPAPRVRFKSFGASSLDLELQGWIQHPELRGRTLDKINTAVYKRFNAEGIEIAFPQQDLNIRSVPAEWHAPPEPEIQG
jgi:MscS family membrane protein